MMALVATPAVFAQKRETRNVDPFTQISFRHSGKLYLRQGATQKVELLGEEEVLKEIKTRVSGGKLIISREDNWSLFSWGTKDDLTVYVTVPVIEGISVAGSGDIIVEGPIRGDDMELAVSGSGNMELEVHLTGDLDANVSGSGTMKVKAKCRKVESDVSGSGRVSFTGEISRDAEFGISGSGRIEATGSAERMHATISGSGKVLAVGLKVQMASVRISGSGDVEIEVGKELEANISGSGSVSYKGNPSKVNSNSSGSGRVRKI